MPSVIVMSAWKTGSIPGHSTWCICNKTGQLPHQDTINTLSAVRKCFDQKGRCEKYRPPIFLWSSVLIQVLNFTILKIYNVSITIYYSWVFQNQICLKEYLYLNLKCLLRIYTDTKRLSRTLYIYVLCARSHFVLIELFEWRISWRTSDICQPRLGQLLQWMVAVTISYCDLFWLRVINRYSLR